MPSMLPTNQGKTNMTINNYDIFFIGTLEGIPTYIVVINNKPVPEIPLDDNNDNICGPWPYVCRIAGISPIDHGWNDENCCEEDIYVGAFDETWVLHKYTERICRIDYFYNFQYTSKITSLLSKKGKATRGTSQDEVVNRLDTLLSQNGNSFMTFEEKIKKLENLVEQDCQCSNYSEYEDMCKSCHAFLAIQNVSEEFEDKYKIKEREEQECSCLEGEELCDSCHAYYESVDMHERANDILNEIISNLPHLLE